MSLFPKSYITGENTMLGLGGKGDDDTMTGLLNICHFEEHVGTSADKIISTNWLQLIDIRQASRQTDWVVTIVYNV